MYILLDDKKKYINEFYFTSYNIYYIINIFVNKKKKKFWKISNHESSFSLRPPSHTYTHVQTQNYVFNQNKNLTRPRRVAHIIVIRITRVISYIYTLKFEICNRFGPRKFVVKRLQSTHAYCILYNIGLAYVCSPRQKIIIYTVEWRITRHYHDITIHNTIIRLCALVTPSSAVVRVRLCDARHLKKITKHPFYRCLNNICVRYTYTRALYIRFAYTTFWFSVGFVAFAVAQRYRFVGGWNMSFCIIYE